MKVSNSTRERSLYSSPAVTVLSLSVERVFAASPGNWYDDESNDANIGWSYSEDEVWG